MNIIIILSFIALVCVVSYILVFFTPKKKSLAYKEQAFYDALEKLDDYIEHQLDSDMNILGHPCDICEKEHIFDLVAQHPRGKELLEECDIKFYAALTCLKDIDEDYFIGFYDRNFSQLDISTIEIMVEKGQASGILLK
jgi:hypothetical protein